MSGVLTQDVGRMDLLIHRGASERFGVLWEQSSGGRYLPVDLSGWACTATFTAPDGTVLLAREAEHSVNGTAACTLTPADTSADTWAAIAGGAWRITASKDGRTDVLAWGNFTLA